jgi:hypothetical protein
MLETKRLTEQLDALAAANRDDVLSLSLNTDPSVAENQRPNPAYRVWAHDAVRRLLRRLPAGAAGRADPVAQRVLTHVDAMPRADRGVAVFAGPRLWQVYTVPFPLPNHLTYGVPDAVALLWALHEYAPYAIVLASHDHARLLVAYLGRTVVVDELELALDTSQWQRKSGRMATSSRRSGVGVGRGVQHDEFNARVLAQYRGFWHEVAAAASRMVRARSIERIIMGGDQQAAAAVTAALPRPLRDAVGGAIAVRLAAPPAEIQDRALPVALAYRHARDRRLVRAIVEERRPRGTGVDGAAATLAALAAGKLGIVVARRDMRGATWACPACGAIGAVSGMCDVCGGEIRRVALPQALPVLARRHGAVLELVAAEAALPLREGIGGALRRPSVEPAALGLGA